MLRSLYCGAMRSLVTRRKMRQVERVRQEQLALARSWDAAQKALADPVRRARLLQSMERLDRV